MRVLVTGGTGFVGARGVRALLELGLREQEADGRFLRAQQGWRPMPTVKAGFKTQVVVTGAFKTGRRCMRWHRRGRTVSASRQGRGRRIAGT